MSLELLNILIFLISIIYMMKFVYICFYMFVDVIYSLPFFHIMGGTVAHLTSDDVSVMTGISRGLLVQTNTLWHAFLELFVFNSCMYWLQCMSVAIHELLFRASILLIFFRCSNCTSPAPRSVFVLFMSPFLMHRSVNH